MRTGILFILLLISLVTLATEDDRQALCSFKADVAAAAYLYRNQFPIEEMFTTMDKEWEEYSQDTWPYAAYVDSKRIINDAYRKNGGNFRRPCCTEAISQIRGLEAMIGCARNGW